MHLFFYGCKFYGCNYSTGNQGSLECGSYYIDFCVSCYSRCCCTRRKAAQTSEEKHPLWDASPSTARTCSLARARIRWRSSPARARIFGEPFHVVTFDKSQHEYYAKLSDFHAQFRMVGNNNTTKL